MGRNVEEELRVRARQQAVVAELGQRALASIDLAALMDEAVERVAETLRVEYTKVLELLPDGEALLLRAGVGWQAGLVGQATVSAGLESQAGYTLLSSEPVIVEDLSTETRFSGPPLLHDHGVVSGISVVIQGEGRPFGVMGAHTASRRTFTPDDTHFLQATANVLAAAVQRKRAEEVVRESEARFRVLTEHALAGVYLIQDDRFCYVNPALAAMFGYTPEELIGRLGPLDLTAPEDRERLAENMQQRVEGEVDSVHHTFRGLRKDGTLFECESLGSQGQYAGRPAVLGMLLDITERKRAEVALRESEEKYRSLFEHANDSIFIMDPATRRFLDVNENAARRLGYTREELLQLTFDDIDTPMAAARNEAIIRELQEAGSVVFEHAHRRKDGAEMPVEISSRVIEYGGRQVFQSFVRDITERKLAEERQAHFQSLLRAISDVNQLIVRARDPQAMLQEACQILQRTRGYAGLWIGLLDEAGQHLRQVASAGIATDVESVAVSLDEPDFALHCARTALAERRPCLIRDVGESHPCDTCTYRAHLPHAGALAVPLLHRQGCYGVLVVYTERPWAYDEDETELLSELASDLALGLYTLEAEEKLRESEERFRNAFERAAIGRGIAAPDGQFLQANQSFCDIVGYPMEEFLQKRWQDITHPADSEASARHVRQLMAGEVPSFRFEHRLVHKDGHAVWVDLNVVLIRDWGGNPLYMVGDIVDVTERKELEETLSSERDEFNFILQELPVGVTVLDSEDKYVYINPASLKIDGYKNNRDSLIGQDVRSNHPPHTLATVEEVLRDFKAGERSAFSREARRGRRTVTISYHALRSPEGEYQGLLRLVTDITERRQAAEALRASEEKYRLLLETANETIVVAQDGMLKFFNPKAMEVTGYSQEELASKLFPELIHPDDSQMVVENHLKRLAGETLPQTYAFRIVDKSGNTKWMEINAVVIDWEGRPATLNLLTDITERKQAEELLRESEEKYRGLFNESVAAIYVFDAKKNFIDSNQAGLNILGYSREELLSMSIPDVDADSGVVLPAHQQLLSGERIVNYEHQLKRKDGRIITVLNNSRPLTDAQGNVVGMQSTLIDMTERKRAEAALREHSERLEEMVKDRTADLAYRAGQLEHLRELDASLLGATGLEATLQLLAEGAVTHLGYNGAAVGLYHPEEQSLVVPAIYPLDSRIEKLRALAGAPGPGALRFSLSGKGTLFDRVLAGETMLASSLTQFLDAPLSRVVAQGLQKLYRFGCVQFVPLMVEGEVVGVLMGGVRERDPSARKQAGLALLAGHAAVAIQQAQLREAEQRRTAQLEAALSELEQAQEQLVRREKLATLGQLAGGVAHELRNPLGAISNAAYYLNLVLEEPQPAVKEALEVLDREVRTSDKIISSLLDYARTRPPIRQAVNVNALVQKALTRAGVPDNIQVTTDLDETLPAIQADPDQLAQVFDNLIRNAVQAMPAGGQLSVISHQSSVISNQLSVISSPSTDDCSLITDNWLLITVRDTGVGIPPENLDKLFEPLFTTKAKGIGLGLALCKMLVEGNGGMIEVESEVGQGTTFTVKLN